MIPRWSSLTLTCVVVVLIGCSSDGQHDCAANRCTDVLRLDLRDPSGARVLDGVVITSTEASPSFDPLPCGASESCSYFVAAPPGDLIVSAPGYRPVTVHYERETDECGAPISQSIEVTLEPSDTSTPPTLTRTLSATCG